DGIGDGVVEASVQRAELFDGKRRVALERQVGHCLTEVAIVMDDLVDGVSEFQQFLAMRGGGHAHLREHRSHTAGCPGDPLAGRSLAGLVCFQRLGELVQEHRNAIAELARRGRPPRTARHLLLAATDQLVAIVGEKGMHHGARPSTAKLGIVWAKGTPMAERLTLLAAGASASHGFPLKLRRPWQERRGHALATSRFWADSGRISVRWSSRR